MLILKIYCINPGQISLLSPQLTPTPTKSAGKDFRTFSSWKFCLTKQTRLTSNDAADGGLSPRDLGRAWEGLWGLGCPPRTKSRAPAGKGGGRLLTWPTSRPAMERWSARWASGQREAGIKGKEGPPASCS